MGAVMRALDWTQTPLGPVESWPVALRMMAKFLVANRFPMLLWWGPEFCQLYNDAYRPILGAKHPQFVGRPVRECWSEIWHILEPLIRTPFAGGPATWMEDILLEVNRYGFLEETHFTIAYSPVPDDTAPGGIGGVLATVHEITGKIVGERRTKALRDLGAAVLKEKTAEKACVRSAEILTNYPKDIPFALLYLLDSERKLARLTASIGVKPGELISPAVIEVSRESAAWPLSAVRETGQIKVVEELGRKFGHVPAGPWSDPPDCAAIVPIRATAAHQFAGLLVAGLSPRLRFDDTYRGFLELASSQIATAVANARAYEEERRRAEALAEIDRAKTAFFTNISHEFRTPLSLMLSPLEETIAEPGLAPRSKARLELAHRNSLRLLRLVNTLLDFSRIEAGRTQAVYEPVELGGFTAELASVFRSAVEHAGMKLIVTYPPLEQPVYVDREMWEKIVLNLLSNAFKFTLEGEIEVSVKAVGDHVELAVRDTGSGMSREDLAHIFNRFYRVRSTRGRSYEGSGIGLALVQELAKLHGGTVRVASELGKGSTFVVSVPFGSAHLPAERIGVARTSASTATAAAVYVQEALRSLPIDDNVAHDPAMTASLPTDTQADCSGAASEPAYVLLADDNADMREYLRRLLSAHYQVVVVPDGQAALEAALQHPPDLVLTDVMMPRLDGFGLLKALRSHERTASIPVILLSARAGEESRVEGMSAGADDYLVKPFSARELVARVEKNLALSRLRRETESRLTDDVSALTRMHALSRKLLGSEGLQPLLQEVMNAAVAIMRAGFGTLQLLEGDSLRILAQCGHQQPFLDFFASAENRASACGAAMMRGERVIIPDVESSALFAGSPSLPVLRQAGVRAVQSTPLVSRTGALLGILTTQWSIPHSPGEYDLWRLDLLARQAADLIEYTKSATALRASEERLSFALQAADLGTWDWDMVSGKLFWSPRCYALFGLAPGTPVTHQRFLEALHPDDRERIDQAVRSALEKHQEYNVEMRTIWPDGSLHSLSSLGRAYYDATGKPVRMSGVTMDITQRKLSEEALIRTEKLASVGRMAATIAHEINNPLEAVTNVLFLAKASKNRSSTRQYLEIADEELKRVSHITRQALGFYRESSVPASTSVRSVIDSAINLLKGKITSKHARVEAHCAGDVQVVAVAGELRQVFSNLLSNSLDAIEERGIVTLRVSTGTALNHGYRCVRITIADNGTGIETNSLPHIFEPFFTTKGTVGTGLGLWVSKQIIDKHGGTIRVRSRTSNPHRGTVVSVVLPVEAAGR